VTFATADLKKKGCVGVAVMNPWRGQESKGNASNSGATTRAQI
jgi:hypothetical protein